MNAVLQAAPEFGAATICAAIGLPRATFYRHRPAADRSSPTKRRPTPGRALALHERRAVLDALHSERFADQAPAEVYATLLDEGRYLCSIRTMYRILDAAQEVRERRDQLRHPQYHKPELLATGPNQVWSWDITKLLGPVKWSYFYLYVIMDIFNRPRPWRRVRKRCRQRMPPRPNVSCSDNLVHCDYPMRSGSTLPPPPPNPQRIHCPRYTKFHTSVSQSR